MAWTETLSGATWTQHLDNGLTPTGAVQTVNLGMGTLNKDAWDVDKAGAILTALEPVLAKTIVRSVHTQSYNIMADE